MLKVSLKTSNRLKMAARTLIILLFLALGTVLVQGQDAPGRLKINLDKLATKASESVEITIDERLLKLAAKLLSSSTPDEAKIKELVAGLKGVYVRSYEFDQPGGYSPSDIEEIRAQLRAPGWSKIVGVRSRKEGENVEVFTLLNGNNIVALAIIAADPKELTVVNIVGPIDLEKLSQLEGQLGIPHLGLEGIKPRKE
jgi:Domain of unknown function (DUF4252)